MCECGEGETGGKGVVSILIIFGRLVNQVQGVNVCRMHE